MGGSSATLFSQHTKVIFSHHVLIHLGDLQRYRMEVQNPEPQDHAYAEAESFYKQAIALDPTNGDGHHKLAVIASNRNCNYLALYQYCRALGCRMPYLSSLKNVKVLFAKNEKMLRSYKSEEKVTNWKENRDVGVSAIPDSQLLLCQFIALQSQLFTGLQSEEKEIQFMRLLNSCISLFCTLFPPTSP